MSGLKEKIETSLKGNALVLESEVYASPPTLMRNSRFVKPFETITNLYGLPHYDELDPTPFLAITFPIIFGLMFGDVGHGLVLVLGGSVFALLSKQSSSGIKNLAWILAACGLGSVISGVLFGEYFGLRLIAPLWFSPFENVMQFLIFSLYVGVIQLTFGIVLEFANFLLKRKFADAFFTSIPKIAFYMGAVYVISVYQLDLAAWFSGPLLIIIVPFVLMVVAKPIFNAASRSMRSVAEKKYSEHESIVQRLFDATELMTSLLSNTMSYTRILALLMAHWALVQVVQIVAGLLGASLVGSTLGVLILAFGNLLIIVFEGLIVFINTLRLHFYEWFSKFYNDSGIKFSPFKQNHNYTEIVSENN